MTYTMEAWFLFHNMIVMAWLNVYESELSYSAQVSIKSGIFIDEYGTE